MPDTTDIAAALQDMLGEILEQYDERVPERSRFPDVRAGRGVHFGDPDVTRPGRVELAVMHMDTEIDKNYDQMRFLAVRVWKSRDGGTASSTCFHGTKPELRKQLELEQQEPDQLLDRVHELAHGLPEETNPDVWR